MRVSINDIRVGHRLRQARPEQVAQLAASIGVIGLRTPISVATGVFKREDGGSGVSFDLVTGLHRLEACRSLGHQEIEAQIVQMDSDERALWEIDENLCRADLTELERGVSLLKRKEVCKRMPQPRSPSRQFGVTEEKSFVSETSDEIGLPERTIQRAIQRVRRIDEPLRAAVADLPAVAGSGVELDALGKLEARDQRKVVDELKAGRAKSVREAVKSFAPATPRPLIKTKMRLSQEWRATFLRLIAKGTQEDIEWAKDQLDRPIADNTAALRVVK